MSTQYPHFLAWICLSLCMIASATQAMDDDEAPLWSREFIDGGLCSFSPDGKLIATVDGHAVLLLNARTGKPAAPPLRHEDSIRVAAFSPDGKSLLTASDDKTARAWSVSDGREIYPPLRHEKYVWTACFNPDGTRILTVVGKQALIWDAINGKRMVSIEGRGSIGSAAFSPDGKSVLLVVSNEKARLLGADSGGLVGEFGTTHVERAAFSPDGKRIATADEDGVAYLWDVASGKRLGQTERDWNPTINSVAFSRDGKKLATSAYGSIRVWDGTSGKPLTKRLGTGADMMHVAEFSLDGRYVLGAGEGAQAVVWDVETGRIVAQAHGFDAYLHAAFSPDGRRFVTCGVNLGPNAKRAGAISAWALPVDRRKAQ
jgi:WD40 repeat protein